MVADAPSKAGLWINLGIGMTPPMHFSKCLKAI